MHSLEQTHFPMISTNLRAKLAHKKSCKRKEDIYFKNMADLLFDALEEVTTVPALALGGEPSTCTTLPRGDVAALLLSVWESILLCLVPKSRNVIFD